MMNKLLQIIELGYCKLFAARAVLNRLQYLKGNVLLAVILAFLGEAINSLEFIKANIIFHQSLMAVIMALAIYYCSRAFIARLHDVGLSAWYFFAFLIAYNIIAFKFKAIAMGIMIFWHLFAFIFPGKTKNNKYLNSAKSDNKNNIFIA